MKLWEIEQEYMQALESCIDMETGEILDAEKMEQVQDKYCKDRTAKIDNTISYIKNEQALADAIAEQIKILSARKKAKENTIASITNYLGSVLDGEAFESAKHKISYRKSESVEINMDLFVKNADYEKYVTYAEPKPSKADIKKAIKDGIELQGAEIVVKQNMQIK